MHALLYPFQICLWLTILLESQYKFEYMVECLKSSKVLLCCQSVAMGTTLVKYK